MPPPVITAVNISVTGATGSGGVFKIGDTVTARWDNSASGDNNDGVQSVTMDFWLFGAEAAVTATEAGGIWTATYTIPEGPISDFDLDVLVSASNADDTDAAYSNVGAALDNIRPLLDPAESSPVAGSFDIALDSDITLGFNEDIQLGAGNILLKDETGATVQSFDVAGLSVSNDTEIVLNPTSDLSRLTTYYIEIEAGAVLDAVGNGIAAIAGDDAYIFTTLDAAPIDSTDAGFDSADGTNLSGPATAGNDTIRIADNAHLAGSTIDGKGGSDTLAFAQGGAADLTGAASVAGISVIRMLNAAGLSLTVSADKGLNVDRISGGAGGDTLKLAGPDDSSFDIAKIILTGVETLTVGSGGATTLTMGEDQLCGCGLKTIQGGGGGILTTPDTIIDLSGMTISGFSTLRIDNAKVGVFALDQADIDTLSRIEAGEAGADIGIVNGEASFDLSKVALSNIDAVESVAEADAVITLAEGQIAGLKAIYGDVGYDTMLSIKGDFDLRTIELTGIEILRTTDADGGAVTLNWSQIWDGAQSYITQIVGGAGSDTLVLHGDDGDSFDLSMVTLVDWERVETKVAGAVTAGFLSDDLTLIGGVGADQLTAIGNGNRVEGGAGADTIAGQGDNNTLVGGGGDDDMQAEGEGNLVEGGDGNDHIIAASESNTLRGGDGNDRLDAGAAKITMTGGAGNDEFRAYDAEFFVDGIITDFGVGDRIVIQSADLSALNGQAASGGITVVDGEAVLTLTGLSAASGSFSASYDGDQTVITLVAPPPDPVTPVLPPIDSPDTPPVVGPDGSSITTEFATTETADGLSIRIDQTETTANGNSLTTRIQATISETVLEGGAVRETAVSTVNAPGRAPLTLTRERTSVTEALDETTTRVTTTETLTGSDGSSSAATVTRTTQQTATGTTISTVSESSGGIRLIEEAETTASSGPGQESRTIRWEPVEGAATPGQSVAVDLIPIENDLPDVPGVVNHAALQADIPSGVTVRSEGARDRGGGAEALADLLNRIEARAEGQPDALRGMSRDGTGFLDLAGDGAALSVRTVTLEAPGWTGDQPPAIVLRGETGGFGAARQEALVIDATQLPAGTVLTLDNVEFAAVFGPVEIVGGAGDNYVTGDDAVQVIVLGGGNNIIHGGGGHDRLGSGGGDDTIQGGMNGDSVSGSGGNDELRGGKGHDRIEGGSGDDVLYSGFGDDTLSGGDGADLFVLRGFDASFSNAVLTASVTDFQQGADRLAVENATLAELEAAIASQTATADGVVLEVAGARLTFLGVGAFATTDIDMAFYA